MTELYYNNSYGIGLGGFLNYTNSLVDGWMANLFIIFIFIASIITLSKSEWSMPGISAFSFFLCLITAMMLNLFLVVNNLVMFILGLGLAVSIAWGILSKYNR